MTALKQDAATMNLAEAYRTADYFVDLEGDAIEVAVGHPAVQLEARLPAARTFAYITAWNPESEPQTEDCNLRADGELRATIDRHRYPRWPMISSSADGRWREDGWLVGDPSRVVLDEWAQRFRQRGVLLWRRGEPVRLRMYGPAEFPHPQIDWIE